MAGDMGYEAVPEFLFSRRIPPAGGPPTANLPKGHVGKPEKFGNGSGCRPAANFGTASKENLYGWEFFPPPVLR